ncbi:GNAT family N-acetyltransferase [Streptomyces sp. CA-251387]|uniref:GNAT family N-acetyltransferase n=1 Tax=Streptomyces sp. CA-251387 TaxID=3240064 RepID=UPI003D8C9D10
MGFLIRNPHAEELEAVGKLTEAAYRVDGLLPPETQDYGQQLRDAQSRARKAEIFVAVTDLGDLLGTVTFTRPNSEYAQIANASDAEFRMLAVAPEGRKQGVGQALVQKCIAQARREGFKRLIISTKDDMYAAHRLYERIGFYRLPSLDWSPLPGVALLVYGIDLANAESPWGPMHR